MPEQTGSSSENAAVVRKSVGRKAVRGLGFLLRTLRNLLAVAMLVQLLMILSPLPERLHDYLSVATPSPGKADFIVCLGGGSGREARAAQLWHQKVAPMVIVSNIPGAADYMQTLVARCGVPREKILVDNLSPNTAAHPEGVARVPGVNRETSRLVIVTDRTHTRRAGACFAKAGYKRFEMYAGKEYRRLGYWDRCKWRVVQMPALIYEYAALLKYHLTGRI